MMTQQEKRIKRYVTDIERRLRLPLKVKARINGDIGTEIHARLEQGQTLDEVFAQMGTPEEVAAGFNDELAELALPKGSAWRWLFAVLAVLTGIGTAQVVVPAMLFRFSMQSAGAIGGADGPTAIYVTGTAGVMPVICLALMTSVPFILGCAAAFVLLRWGKNATRSHCTRAALLSAAALVCWVAACVWMLVSAALGAQGAPGMWGALLWQIVNLMLLPGFWLPIVTLVIALRRQARADGSAA